MDALGALIDAALPVFGVVAVSAALLFFACLFLLFGKLVVAPRRYWLLAALVGLNVMTLPPLWSAGWDASSRQPDAWAQARAMVVALSVVLPALALGWYLRCRRLDAAAPSESRPTAKA
jgi:hypothetical protein